MGGRGPVQRSARSQGRFGGVAVAAATVAGVILTAPVAGALLFGGALVGSFFGAEGATQLYELMHDRDENTPATSSTS